MELVPGSSLAALLRREGGRLPPKRAANIAMQALAGLAVAHRAGIIHRDVKPGNLLVAPGDSVKVCDFGMAKLDDDGPRTTTGTILGTLAYMSPEQLRGEELDLRADLFSVGVCLYEMLEGRRAHPGDPGSVVRAILLDPPPPLSDTPLASVVRRALAKDRNERYASAEAMRTAVASAIRPRRRTRIWLAATVLTVVIGGVAGGGFVALRSRREMHVGPPPEPERSASVPETPAPPVESAAPAESATPTRASAALPSEVHLYFLVAGSSDLASDQRDAFDLFRPHMMSARRCYERAGWKTNARHVYRVDIDEKGRAKWISIKVVPTDVPVGGAVEACIRSVLAGAKYPAATSADGFADVVLDVRVTR
jgi:hypothetical protein